MITARQVHRAIAILIAAFVMLHLGTHLFAWGGVDAHTAALEKARLLYRHSIAESMLVLAIITQVLLGLRLAISRLREGVDRGWGRIQIASGVALAIFLLAHTGAALSARWLGGIETNFYWPAGTLLLSPLKYGFWPYYLIAVSALFAHVASAFHFAGRERAARALLACGLVFAPLVVLPFSGAIYPVELPDDHLTYFAGLGADIDPVER